jgi:hypothetical protein
MIFFENFLSKILSIEAMITGANTVSLMPADIYTQWLVVLTGLVVKPVYMVLSLILIILLWKQKSRAIVLIRWALVLFLLGESFCAANYLVTGGENEILEILHGLGMVGLSSFLPWGMFTLADHYILHFSEEKKNCTLLPLCGKCWKQYNVSCGLKRLFLFAAPTLAVIALIPITIPLRPINVAMMVFDVETQFNFSIGVLYWELRLYPILAFLLMISSIILLKGGRKRIQVAQAPFFVGFGFLLYSLFRFFLLYSFENFPHWANFWEEITELIMIIGLSIFFIIFRRQLGLFQNLFKKNLTGGYHNNEKGIKIE